MSGRGLSEQERDVVRRLASGFGWPTVALTAALLAIIGGVMVLWSAGAMPLALGFAVNTIAIYAMYTVHHEATHRTISNKNPDWRVWDKACGTVAGWVLGLAFESYAQNHLRHHAHTNTERDPDLFVKGSLRQLPLTWLVLTVLSVAIALPRGEAVNRRILEALGAEARGFDVDVVEQIFASQQGLARARIAIVIVSIPFGLFVPVFFLWWTPSLLSIFLLMVLFQWLPHFPFDQTERFRATRITLFPGSTWLLLQQDRHLIHHLYPSIPWYRYRAAYRELLPLLRAEDATIAGPRTDPRQPIQLR